MLDSVARVIIMFGVLEAKSDPLSDFSWGEPVSYVDAASDPVI